MNTISPLSNLKSIRTAIVIGLLVLALVYRLPILNILRRIGDPDQMAAYLRSFGPTGPIVVFLLMVAQVFIALIPGHALVMASGYVYGAPLTIAVVSAAAIFGSQVAFSLARRSGRPLIYRLAPGSSLEKWNSLAGDRGPLFYFFAFVLPIFPSDLMCYVAGLGKVSPRGFFAANFVGRLLCTITITLIGSYALRPPAWFWFGLAGSLAVLFLAWRYYDRSITRTSREEQIARSLGLWISRTYRAVFGVRYNVRGLENLPPGPKILAANHPGPTDGVFLPALFPEDLVLLAEWHQFHSPILGWILSRGGHIPVGSGYARECYEQARRKLSEGKTLLIFAEGTVNPGYAEMRAKSGAVRLAVAAGVPIVPIGVYVDRRDTLNLRFHAFGRPHLGCFQFRGRYSVRVGRPWRPGSPSASGQKAGEVHELTGDLMCQVRALVQQAREDIEEENSCAHSPIGLASSRKAGAPGFVYRWWARKGAATESPHAQQIGERILPRLWVHR
jgi:1-acyl-sn-glycerol-3-phosphate acyltransferase